MGTLLRTLYSLKLFFNFFYKYCLSILYFLLSRFFFFLLLRFMVLTLRILLFCILLFLAPPILSTLYSLSFCCMFVSGGGVILYNSYYNIYVLLGSTY